MVGDQMDYPFFLKTKKYVLRFFRFSVMDAHAVPRVVSDEVVASKAKPQSWTDEYTKTVTDWARQFGIRGAINRHVKGEFKDICLPFRGDLPSVTKHQCVQ